MSEQTPPDSCEELLNLQEENKQLNREISRLNRELKGTKTFLSNATKAMNAKDAMSRVLSETSARQRAYTNMLLENCPSIILLLNKSGNFVLSTKAFLKEANIHNFDFIKNTHYKTVFSKYLSKESLDKFEEAVRQVAECRESLIIDDWIDFSGSGNKRYYSIEISAGQGNEDTGDSEDFGVIAVFLDLTDFMREKQRAEDASNAKSDFLATMSHEIRTPMNAILGMSEMLGRSNLDDTQQKYLSDIQKSSQSLLSIINDVLDFSKIEAGRMELVQTNYNLRGLLDNLYSMFSHLFQGKGLEFAFEIDSNFPYYVCGDENRLRQILTNLLSNALKYTQQGRVRMSVYLQNDDTLAFDIQDSGIGIREEDKNKLFAPFEQLDLRKNKNVVGTGLGLAISFNLCRVMGGRLWLESEYGHGSTFHAEIPYTAAEEAFEEQQSEVSDFTAPGASVLVVDDMEINLAVAEAMLSVFGIEPDMVSGGFEAVKRTNEKQYDVIFMDHMMPDMDGVEAAKIIHTTAGPNKNTVIVALTANVVNGMREMFLKNGFDDFLSKPLEISSLNLCLRRWLPAELITGGE